MHVIILLFLIGILFFVDIIQFFLLGKQYIPVILSLYSSSLLLTKNYCFFIILIVLQCLITFCFFSHFFIPFLYIIPTFLSAYVIQQIFYPSLMHIILLTLFSLLINCYVIEGGLFDMWSPGYCTFLRISGTLLVVICFSLIIKYRGAQGNRA